MKKKIVFCLLIAVILSIALCLVACSGDGDGTVSDGGNEIVNPDITGGNGEGNNNEEGKGEEKPPFNPETPVVGETVTEEEWAQAFARGNNYSVLMISYTDDKKLTRTYKYDREKHNRSVYVEYVGTSYEYAIGTTENGILLHYDKSVDSTGTTESLQVDLPGSHSYSSSLEEADEDFFDTLRLDLLARKDFVYIASKTAYCADSIEKTDGEITFTMSDVEIKIKDGKLFSVKATAFSQSNGNGDIGAENAEIYFYDRGTTTVTLPQYEYGSAETVTADDLKAALDKCGYNSMTDSFLEAAFQDSPVTVRAYITGFLGFDKITLIVLSDKNDAAAFYEWYKEKLLEGTDPETYRAGHWKNIVCAGNVQALLDAGILPEYIIM